MTSPESRTGGRGDSGAIPILSFQVRIEADIVAARQRARQVGALLGYDVQHQTRLATAVSEIVRNAFNYAGGGRIEFAIEGRTAPQLLVVRVVDSGPGILNIQQILEGRYQSPTGMGLGILGARRLMDQFHIESEPGAGTTVTMTKLLPRRGPLITPETLPSLLDELARNRSDMGPLDEMQQQNRELLATLNELSARQEELERLNRELEDTNRGVVALYAELDEKADHLRRADEMKSRFLSNMSHEFRTPLNSILALSRLLLDHVAGNLTPDQERQVTFIRKGAESLYELVNDLLDLAKVEAGKITLHPAEFDVHNLFGALRGMLRPLLVNTSVNLLFDEPEAVPAVVSDEAKISQILRNFISNALKFTERGEVRVSARREDDRVIFSVADTGIGIDPVDLERIFEEYAQIDSPIQRKVKGTGLGLPLSRKLAELLGGGVSVESTPGVGSTFSLTIPVVFGRAAAPDPAPPVDNGGKTPVLVVEDHLETRLLYEEYLKNSPYYLVPASTISEARAAVENISPRAIVLDLLLANENGCTLLAELKGSEDTKAIPVLVISAVDDPRKVYGLGADVYAVKPVAKKWLLDSLDRCTRARRILLVDDDPAFRYLARQLFTGAPLEFVEAENGLEGLEAAHRCHPDLLFLDLMMPRMNGFEMLEQLRSSPETRDIPVIVSSSRHLGEKELRHVEGLGAAILSKDEFAAGNAAEAVREILTRFGLSDLCSPGGN
jgi:signal transduction histidine kinase/DNA-binding response OmpR family regulator